MCTSGRTGAMAAGVPTKVLSRTKEPKSQGPVDSPRLQLLGRAQVAQVHAPVRAQAHVAGLQASKTLNVRYLSSWVSPGPSGTCSRLGLGTHRWPAHHHEPSGNDKPYVKRR